MTVKKQHAPDLMSGGAIRDGKGRIIDQTYALKTEVLAGSTNVTEGTFDELPANPNEGDIHILTKPYIDSDYTEGLIDPKLERVKYHTGTEFVKGKNSWNRISNTGNKVNEWDYQVKTHFIPSTGVVKIARIAQFSNITFRAIYNVPAPSKETSSCTITFAGGSAIGRADNKSAVTNLCFYKQGTTNYLCIKPNGLATITIDLYDVKFYRGSLTPIEPEALTSEQVEDVTYFTELGESKEIVIDPTDTDNVLTLGLRKESQDDNTAYLDFNANSGIQSINTEKGLYHIVNTTIFEQSVFYWNGKTCYRSGGNYTTPVEVSDIDLVRLDLDYINPGTYYFVNTKPINNGLTITSYRDISTQLTNSLDELIPANTTIGFTITEDNISFFKKNQGEYVKTVSGYYPDEEGDVNIDDHFVTITTPQRILGEKKFTYNTYVEHLYFGTGVITGDTALLESDSGENLRLINSKLRLSRSGSIQLGDDYAITGDVVYNYINNNVVTLNGNQTIVGTKNFEDLEVNNSIKFNSGLGATPVGTIEVNNNQLKVTDAKLELEESGNIVNGDNYAVNANAVKSFVEGKVNVITLNGEETFNFNNPSNFPEQNEIKRFITTNEVNCIAGPYAKLSSDTIIEFYRSSSNVETPMVVQKIISHNDKVIYARTVWNNGSNWVSTLWTLLNTNLDIVNKGSNSVAHKENTYNDSVSNTSNTILGTNNVFFNGSNNFTAGRQHQINGNNNVAGGISNNIAYSYAAAFGGYNVIKNNGASAFGMWSNTDANSYFTIGNGTDVSNRSNLLDIKTNGDIIIKYNGSNVKLQDYLTDIKEFNIFVIGNSFTLDSFQYIPAIAKDLGLEINIVQFYHGGNTSWQISTYKDIILDDTAFCDIYKYDKNDNAWILINGNASGKFSTAINLYDHFDVVIINQYSVANVSETDTIEPAQLLISNLVQEPKFKGAKFGFFASPVYANGYSNLTTLGYANSQEMWMAQTEVNKKVVLSAFDFFIPANTAIENARTNASFDALGTFGHLSYDGQHLQEGLPCFISAITSLYVILEQICGIKVSIGTNVNPDALFLYNQNIQGIHGTCVGINNTNKSLAYHCVRAAIEQPYQISVINSLGAEYKDYYVNTNRIQIIEAHKTFNNGINLGTSSMTEANNAIEVVTNDFNVNGQSVKCRRPYSNNTKARILSVTVYGSTWNDNGENNYPRICARKEVSGTITETTSVAMHDDNIAFALNRTTEWGFVNATSNSNENWNTKEIPTKSAVATKISAEISNATDIYQLSYTYTGSNSDYLDVTITEHHRTTYIYVSSINTPAIQPITSLAQKGDIIIVDTGKIDNLGGNGCFPPVASTSSPKYHYWPASKSYVAMLPNSDNTAFCRGHCILKWWYDGTDWNLIETTISMGI